MKQTDVRDVTAKLINGNGGKIRTQEKNRGIHQD